MSDYERLTSYMQVGNKVVQIIPQRKQRIQAYIDRLFDLENKIESGELISKKQYEQLQAENAELRARLGKAVELPCIEPMTTWDWDEEKGIEEKHFGDYYQVLYRDEDGEFIASLGMKKEEAEARLKELQGWEE